jgi:ABC-2 type transport system ATP-binding protein
LPASPGSRTPGGAAHRRSPDPLLVCGLGRSFGAVQALAGVDLVVPAGAVVALVGPNGSGKSTLIRVAAGLLAPTAGSVLVSGHAPGSREAARATALVPDDPAGLDELTVAELLSLLAALHGCVDAASRRAALVASFRLEPMLGRRLEHLSRGQRRRASIVAALQLETRLVLVDEATTALDADSVSALADAVADAASRGAGIVVATHDHAFVDAVADDVVSLADGVVAGGAAGACREPVLV